MPKAILYTNDTYLVQMYKKNHVYLDTFLHVTDMTTLDSMLSDDTYVFYDFDGDMDMLANLVKKAKVFVLTKTPSYAQGTQLLQHNIVGYSNRYIAPQHLSDALRFIIDGKVWLYPEFIQEMIQHVHKPEKQTNESILKLLTSKEQEIALHVKKGESNKEIAYAFNITVRTVKAHISSIFEKIGVSDRLTLALKLQ